MGRMELVNDPQPEQAKTTRFVFELSRVCVLWRNDGKFIVAPEEDLDAILRRPPTIPSWTDFDPANSSSMGGVEEAHAGDSVQPTWWVLYGQADPSVDITVHVDEADVPDPPVERVGGVWVCEWVSLPTVAYVHRSDRDQPARIRFDRPAGLPRAPHPESEIGTRKRE
ncbi:hypothetical protein AB4Z17_33495 [Paenibacillus sp. TAF43_2]